MTPQKASLQPSLRLLLLVVELVLTWPLELARQGLTMTLDLLRVNMYRGEEARMNIPEGEGKCATVNWIALQVLIG